jgi:hypothetical protein
MVISFIDFKKKVVEELSDLFSEKTTVFENRTTFNNGQTDVNYKAQDGTNECLFCSLGYKVIIDAFYPTNSPSPRMRDIKESYALSKELLSEWESKK